jgi:asparagine synthase (glutamine-hydrolysing)
MCGICGVISLGAEPRPFIDGPTVNRMTDVMTHRGPNDRGTYLNRDVAFGVRRLSVVDVEGGHQPFASEDGRVVGMQNGELYNHRALRADLEQRGHRFRSSCDTEVLPHLYEQYGHEFVPLLRGMFGLAVWDAGRRRAVIARDRLGIKPVYYAQTSRELVFASELKSVLASGLVPTDLDFDAIDSYLSLGFTPAPRTPLAAVRKLMPGELLLVEDGRVRIERYWDFPLPSADPSDRRTESDWAEELLEILDESVRLRLMADVPLGAMLSGGLDSSLIVALMARRSQEPVKTFSVGFSGAADNELDAARNVANLFGTEHHEIELRLDDADVDLAALSWYMDEPVADLSAVGFLELSRLASEHVTVALSGQGADEMLGGYSRHRNARIATSVDGLPRPVGTLIRRAGRLAPGRFQGVASVVGARDGVERQLAAFRNLRTGLDDVFADGPVGRLGGVSAASDVRARLKAQAAGDPLAEMLFLDGQLGLVDDMLHYFDRTSMACSLEVRVPFLDHKLVEFCAQIPTRLKVKGLTTKHLLKQAARSVLPASVIERPKVGFFNSAVDSWFAAQSEGLIAEYLLAPDPAYAAVASPAAVRELVQRIPGGGVSARTLLPLLMLEIWLREFLPRAADVRLYGGAAA